MLAFFPWPNSSKSFPQQIIIAILYIAKNIGTLVLICKSFFLILDVLKLSFYRCSIVIQVLCSILCLCICVLYLLYHVCSYNSLLLQINFLGIYYRITLNWTLASCYLFLPSLLGCIIKNIGNFCGLPECYFKFIKIVLLSFILNVNTIIYF